MRVIQNALSVRRSCPRPWGDGSKLGNPAQADFIIIIGREIWDGRTLAGRYTAIRPPSPNPEPGLGRESSGPDWGLKGFSDEEATKCSRSWACPNRHLCCSLQQGAGACKTAKRMGWDLNPRAAFATAGFQDRCIQPLCHPSGFRGCIVRRVLAEVYRACRPGRRTVAAGKPPPPASGRGGFDCFPRIF